MNELTNNTFYKIFYENSKESFANNYKEKSKIYLIYKMILKLNSCCNDKPKHLLLNEIFVYFSYILQSLRTNAFDLELTLW